MSRLEKTLARLAEFLDGAGVAYMVIGGFANLHWGKPRLTQDLEYLNPLADQITAALERPAINTFYQGCLKKAELAEG